MHLGGGNSLDENDSLYKFKLSMSTDINNFHFVGRFTKKIFLKCLKENGVKNILKLLINTKTFFKLSFCKLIMKKYYCNNYF